MSQTQKYQVKDYVLKKQSNQVFQVVKVFNIAGKSFKYRLLNLKRLSESAHRESEIERVATSSEIAANKRLPKEKSPELEKIVLTKIGPYQDHWATVYVDPNNTWSVGGGRLTVVMDQHVGSAFFSHVSQPTFKAFIAQCDAGYLIHKLFHKVEKWIPVEDGEEMIAAIAREKLSHIRECRASGEISKDALRELYDELKECSFDSMSHLYDFLDEDQRATMNVIFGTDEWWWHGEPTKLNQVYAYLESMLGSVIAEFKKLSEVMV